MAVGVRKEVDAARHMLTDIDESVLEVAEIAILRTIRFGLDRANDGLRRARPWARDPGYYVLEVQRFVDELEHRLANGQTKGLEAGLAQLPSEIAWATARLQATSAAALIAAATDYDALALRLRKLAERHPDLAPPIGACADAAADAAASLRELQPRLASAKAVGYDDAMPAVKRGEELFKLPDHLGASALRRRLEVEEAARRRRRGALRGRRPEHRAPARAPRAQVGARRHGQAGRRGAMQGGVGPDRSVGRSAGRRCRRRASTAKRSERSCPRRQRTRH